MRWMFFMSPIVIRDLFYFYFDIYETTFTYFMLEGFLQKVLGDIMFFLPLEFEDKRYFLC